MNLINEDEYWERKREEWENPKAFRKRNPWDEEEPIYEDGTIFLDEEIEEIEKKRGWPMAELYEGDLLEIVQEMRGIEGEEATWNESMDAIEYRYRVA